MNHLAWVYCCGTGAECGCCGGWSPEPCDCDQGQDHEAKKGVGR